MEARELDDQLQLALQHAEAHDGFAAAGGRPMHPPPGAAPRSAGTFGRWLVGALVAAALLYGALRVVGMV